MLSAALCTGVAAQPEPGNSFRDCTLCPELVVLPAGAFVMGSPAKEEYRSAHEGPRQRVEFGYRLAVGKYEITYAEWDRCVVAGGCTRRPEIKQQRRARHPITRVSWHDAQAYTGWLSQKTGKPYRLLSEAEWEYAARAGATRAWIRDSEDDDGIAFPTDVGRYRPNRFGLHDMLANVAEWVADCFRRDAYDTHSRYPAALGSLDDDCPRVVRGGSGSNRPKLRRAAFRASEQALNRSRNRGFRVARTIK